MFDISTRGIHEQHGVVVRLSIDTRGSAAGDVSPEAASRRQAPRARPRGPTLDLARRSLCGFAAAAGALSVLGCHSPAAPTPACQANNTATVTFSNTSTSTVQEVVWDGIRVATLQPGQSTDRMNAAANVAHSMIFRDTLNRANRGCTLATPILAQCSDRTFTCGT